jgi:hypothetical protein
MTECSWWMECEEIPVWRTDRLWKTERVVFGRLKTRELFRDPGDWTERYAVFWVVLLGIDYGVIGFVGQGSYVELGFQKTHIPKDYSCSGVLHVS